MYLYIFPEYYTQETIDMVTEAYKIDIDKFEYNFEKIPSRYL
tara:strand:+ start:14053 stop:14178 length:126 start_codon:yes stop_codon:yes gene_type:complete